MLFIFSPNLLSFEGNHGVATADSDDFIKRENNEFLKYAVEQKNAVKTNSFSKYIQEEQEKLVWKIL